MSQGSCKCALDVIFDAPGPTAPAYSTSAFKLKLSPEGGPLNHGRVS